MIQGDVSRQEIITGAVIVAIFLAFAVAAGLLLGKFRNRRFRRAWQPLQSVLANVKVTDDGGGAATSWMSGTLDGRLVHASMSPNVARYSGSPHKGNRFSVIVPDVAGERDWSIVFTEGMPLVGSSQWNVLADDDATRFRLHEQHVVQQIQAFGPSAVRFNSRAHQLTWEALIEPLWTLPPDRFVQIARMLLAVAGRTQ